MAYDNRNRGAIWGNDDKREDNHPDFKGSLNVDGVEYWVSAWRRKEGAAAKAPALSFTVKPKEDQPTRREPERSISERAMPRGPASQGGFGERPARRDPISSGLKKQSIIPDDDAEIPF